MTLEASLVADAILSIAVPDQHQLDPINKSGGAAPNASTSLVMPHTSASQPQVKLLLMLTAVLILCFAKPLYDVVRFALHSELFSHILLIPFVSGYLVWIKKDSLSGGSTPLRGLGLALVSGGLCVLVACWFGNSTGSAAIRHDYLTWMMLSFVLFFAAACCLTLGGDTLRALVFPISFLIFLVPFPGFLLDWIETFLQYASAQTADPLFTVTGMSFLRNGLNFQLPGIQLQVAPECSGIHSSLVLFITSLVAGNLFLATGWKRAALAIAVVPLGILRNAVRIVTIGQLCVHVGPHMIDAPIHRRGGPLFFAVSLLPLLLLLYYLRRSELKTKPQANAKLPS